MEIFRYKVVYPGGTFVRISPHIDSDRTGDILEFGTVFESTKSLVLDGVNYIKLSNGEGWVFEKKNGVEIVELLEVVRPSLAMDGAGGGGVGAAKMAKMSLSSSTSAGALAALGSSSSAGAAGAGYSGYGATAGGTGAMGGGSMDGFGAVGGGDGGGGCSGGAGSSVASRLINQRLAQGGFVGDAMGAANKEKLIRESRNELKFWKDARAQSLRCTSFHDITKFFGELLEQQPALTNIAMGSWVSPSARETEIRRLIMLIVSITRQCVEEHVSIDGLENFMWILLHLGNRFQPLVEIFSESATRTFESYSISGQRLVLQLGLEVNGRTKSHSIDLAKLVDTLPDDIKNLLQRWIMQKFQDNIYDTDSDSEGSVDDSPVSYASSPERSSSSAPHTFEVATPMSGVPGLPKGGADPNASSSWWGAFVCRVEEDANPTSTSTNASGRRSRSKDESEAPLPPGLAGLWATVERQFVKLTNDPNLQLAGII